MSCKNLLPIVLFIFLTFSLTSVTAQKASYSAWNASAAPVIDGVSDDPCWNPGAWGRIDKQWFTERSLPDSADFYGRYKAVWTSDYLYFLVEVTDDILNEDIADPLNNYWEDDCIEIFIDEDKSGGDHRCCSPAYNAFAYHVSPVTYDAVDLSDDGDFVPKLFNDHVDIAVKSKGSLHTLEIAIRIYDDTFNEDQNNTPVELTKDKLMGFSIAYCDDDGNGREDFIGTQQGGLDSWMNASLFGELQLLPSVTDIQAENSSEISIFPNPAKTHLGIKAGFLQIKQFQLYNISGMLLQTGIAELNNEVNRIGIEDYPSGMYCLGLETGSGQYFKKLFFISQ